MATQPRCVSVNKPRQLRHYTHHHHETDEGTGKKC